jgi:hypothetical protein
MAHEQEVQHMMAEVSVIIYFHLIELFFRIHYYFSPRPGFAQTEPVLNSVSSTGMQHSRNWSWSVT